MGVEHNDDRAYNAVWWRYNGWIWPRSTGRPFSCLTSEPYPHSADRWSSWLVASPTVWLDPGWDTSYICRKYLWHG
jgi:hypothetical protein